MNAVALRHAEALLWLAAAAAVLAPASAAPGLSAAPSLDAPPAVQPGEWWAVRITDHRTDVVQEGTMVALSQGSGTGIGIAADSLHPLFFNNHLLPLGRMDDARSYLVHGEVFEPLRFPLTPGSMWSTRLGAVPVSARVESADATEATITYTEEGGKQWGVGTYDSRLGWFSHLLLDHYSEMEVLAHGQRYGCDAVYPEGLAVARPVDPPFATSAAVAWKELFLAPADHDVAMLTMVADPANGAVRQQAVAPDGTLYEAHADPAHPKDAVYAVNRAPSGLWSASAQGTADAFAGFYFTSFHAVRHEGVRDDQCRGDLGSATAASVGPTPGPAWPGTALARLGLLALAFAARHWRKGSWLAIRLFSRLDAGEVTRQPVRRRILEALAESNGLTTQELRRRVGVGWGTINHHLAVLERNGKVLHVRSGRNQTWMGSDTRPEHVTHLAALGVPQLRRIYDALVDRPGQTQADLARHLGLDPSTVNHHARRLTGLGLVRRERAGRRIHLYAQPLGA